MKYARTICLFLAAAGVCALAGCAPQTGIVGSDTPAAHEERDVSVKKGVGVSRYNGAPQQNAGELPTVSPEAAAEKIDSLNIGWYYNWSAENVLQTEAEFVPMVWGPGSVTDAVLAALKTEYEAGQIHALLTFNEPDGDYAGGGCQMTVDEAIALWPKLEALGIPLSSPAPKNYSTGWLDEFMTKATRLGYRVDFIALHCYQDFSDTNAANKLRAELIQIYEKYQKPLWITEFGTIDVSVWNPNTPGGNPACTEAAAKTYTGAVTGMLESLGFVERYAWFVDHFRQSAANSPEGRYTCLFTDDGALSQTGLVFQARQSAAGLEFDLKLLPEAEKDKPYAVQIAVSGGTGSYSFSAVPPAGVSKKSSLPKGLTLYKNGVISGTPQSYGSFNVCVAATDSAGQTTFRFYSLDIY